ncbi:phage tail protein [Pseudomonas sp. R5(2019)]|uniref:phage tail protein n=1 Tax=Pseudomonas sp. R5(2019) TaxID=2697566 RepID=UPI0014120DDF|nr:phage tail protein [Pseudomonas sp. R5(2019)]NBA97977.1 phage tail protein [Pseudomonas sp. R5(2019)]
MTIKTVYQTDHLGIYVGETVADASPLEPGVWLIPARCVEVKPPVIPERKAALWDGERWQLIDSYQGLTAYHTQTRAPIVVDRLGALPAGYTLEVPGPEQIWTGDRWIDDIPAVAELRYQEQLIALNSACQREITGGLWSTALGERYRYSTELDDQVNLTGMALRGLDGPYACYDEQGIKVFRPHTAAQLRQVSDEFTEFKMLRLQKVADLTVRLQNARLAQDLTAINAINWESLPV